MNNKKIIEDYIKKDSEQKKIDLILENMMKCVIGIQKIIKEKELSTKDKNDSKKEKKEEK